ncbi:MAG: NAD(P)/FAD-dependent oxidoreductase [Deltaproteobacteria bacterium]|nr:NAD(P)/FAD-dependent oxidoreductase [Deltaproteobacteria bacterium]
MKRAYDFVIIGAGHNGLTLGCYLARAGQDVVILERRAEFGGGLSTEESTIAGFSHNLHSNFHGAMPFFPPYHDFELEALGLTYIHPKANIGMPLADGRALVLYVDELESYEQIARFSKHDADAWLELRGQLVTHLEDLLAAGYSPPIRAPDAEALLAEEMKRWFGQDLSQMSALDFVKSRFENPHVQALLLFHMAVGGWDIRRPRLAMLGMAFVGYITNWQLCRGGSHHLAHVLGTVFQKAGGDLFELSPVRQIRLENGKACGVTLADGSEVDAKKAVVSTIDPTQTFLEMLPESALAADARARISAIEYGHGDVLFGVHLALSEPPRYGAAKFNPDIDRTFNVNIGYETPEDLVEHYEEIDRNELPKHPRLEVGCNTLFDPTQAPPGKHTGLLWQFVPFEPGGKSAESWRALKKDYAERCIEAWRAYAPNLTPDKILGVYAYSPDDIARKMINMRRGGFHCAAVSQVQGAFNRPTPDLGEMRSPVPGLYLGGASAHPHGGILAAPGYNCFQVLADDFALWSRAQLKPKIWDKARADWLLRLRQAGVMR